MKPQVIVSDPTRAWRDWARTAAPFTDLDGRVWAGGLPTTAYDAQRAPLVAQFPAIVIERVGSTLDVPADLIDWRWHIWAMTASASAHWASVLATALLQTGRVVLGVDDAGNQLVWAATVDSSVAIIQGPTDPNPDLHHHVVTAQAVTFTVPT